MSLSAVRRWVNNISPDPPEQACPIVRHRGSSSELSQRQLDPAAKVSPFNAYLAGPLASFLARVPGPRRRTSGSSYAFAPGRAAGRLNGETGNNPGERISAY
ncbi:hypothetical protein KM043_008403 [Ampulex compressa]|nr:hypothetical protein KM043_008403 [Ampulex compressa]